MSTIRWTGLLLLVAVSSLLAPLSALAEPALPPWRAETPFSTEVAVISAGNVTVLAEISDTDELTTRGLSYRDGLRPGWGMLFIFETSGPRSFWMRGMRFCLDIIWIDRGTITGAAERVCPEPGVPESDLKTYPSGVPIDMVLEMPAGWMDSVGVGPGTKLEISLPVRTR